MSIVFPDEDELTPNWPARQTVIDCAEAERDRLLSIIEEHAQRYSRGSVTRVALDNLALEIRERS